MCQEEGGYYAIKGFLYQYDKTILELLSNEESMPIYVERIQDIDYENYVLQVKHKETAEFSNSKIREPIIKLLDVFKLDVSKKICLYAFFKDQIPHQVNYCNIQDIKNVLKYRDKEKSEALYHKYSDEILEKFISNFTICFSEDYNKQFENVIEKISSKFNVSQEEAWIYHAIICDTLFKVVLHENPEDRYITFVQLKRNIEDCRNLTFERKYQEIVERKQFLKALNKKYFTFKTPNINNYDRLFLIDCHEYENTTLLRQIVDCISNRYYKKGKTPAPYICMLNLNKDILNEVKQGLVDDQQRFSDGTYFDGDRFRKEELCKETDVKVKFFPLENLLDLGVNFKEVYEFYMQTSTKVYEDKYKIKIQIEDIEEVKSLIL